MQLPQQTHRWCRYIYFNIPLTDPGYDATTKNFYYYVGVNIATITTGQINIDATTQQTNQGNTNPHGYEIVLRKGSGTFDYPIMLVSPAIP